MCFLFVCIDGRDSLASSPVSRWTNARRIVELSVCLIARGEATAPIGWSKVQPPAGVTRGDGCGIVVCARQILDEPCVSGACRRRRESGGERRGCCRRHDGVYLLLYNSPLVCPGVPEAEQFLGSS